MKDNKQNDNEQKGFSSNPEKSFEAGKKGGKEATPVANQSSGLNDSNTGASNSLGDTNSRVDPQNRPTQGQSQGDQNNSSTTDTTGKKG